MMKMRKSNENALSVSGTGDDSYYDDVSESDRSECSDISDEHTTTSEQSVPQQIASEESSSVVRWKIALSFMLVAAAVSMVTLALIFLRQEEYKEFESTFRIHAKSIRQGALSRAKTAVQSLEETSDTITSFASLSKKDAWPFITIPHVETRFEHVRHESFTEFVSFAPLINSIDRRLWEKYSMKNQDWITESSEKYNYEGEEYSALSPFTQNSASVSATLYSMMNGEVTPIEPGWGLHAPLWQMSPPPSEKSLVNYDLLSDSSFFLLADPLSYGRAVFSKLWDVNFFLDNIKNNAGPNPTVNEYELSSEMEKKNNKKNNISSNKNNIVSKGEGNLRRSLQSEIGNTISWDVANEMEDKNNEAPLEDDIRGPHNLVLQPVFDSFDYNNRTLTGILMGVFSWDLYLTNLLPKNVEGIVCVIENTCGDVFSYEINGMNSRFLGLSDSHDVEFTNVREYALLDFVPARESNCPYELYIYPTKEFVSRYQTNKPLGLAGAIALVFVVTFFMFYVFVGLVDKRQEKVMTSASRANAIVKSLFPSNVRDRIMKDTEEQNAKNSLADNKPKSSFFAEAAKKKLKSFLDEDNCDDGCGDEGIMIRSKPIADLFPAATVIFADIVGFTAWSSVREPSQVFQLLETIYHSFDMVAKRRRVFKVETIGDCYVAVTGLPDPRKDHAIIMARFARECMNKMHTLTRKLEVSLGPDTGDLTMRIGMHSGPVTAGVLRGEKSRFQLFGDTVNTAARMESNGAKDRIHMSQETANLLIDAGKAAWVTPREGTIQAKGKGELKTFWLQIASNRDTDTCSQMSFSASSSVEDFRIRPTINDNSLDKTTNAANINDRSNVDGTGDSDDDKFVLTPKMLRLVDWNVDQLSRLLKQIVGRRRVPRRQSNSKNSMYDNNLTECGTVLDEVKEVITLPNFDARTFRSIERPDLIELPDDVMAQLHDYVTRICMMYRNVPFHNFEHASHVTMSVSKLLARIVAPDGVINDNVVSKKKKSTKVFASALHDHTYGITSDPLTQFSCVFSALIHDVDHTGVPNVQLVKESTSLAVRYKNKSVAEQNSVDLAWELLMDTQYQKLRRVIYTNETEFHRFRQLIVNSVMATDIADKELKKLRNARWEKAFDENAPSLNKYLSEDRNRKATIVIEHLIQASDIAHTMQHWHIYRKWNERLFRENYVAYKMGRADTDPSKNWYKGEIGFFDFYIIPLAKKLKDCGVFGVSSDEYLNYAVKNREEWEVKGKEIVEDMVKKVLADNSINC